MTPSDLEAMIRNLNTRTTAIEQVLPTLATKGDLREAVRDLATKDDLKDGLAATLAESKQFTLPLYENLKDDIGLLADNLARISQELGAKIVQISQKLDERPRRF